VTNICKRSASNIGKSSSFEDYLEAILLLSKDTGASVRVTDLSEQLGVSKPSVSVAVKKLTEAGLVQHERYGDVKLTAAGQDRASGVASRHDLLFRFFTSVLGVNEETAESDACSIEHNLSETTVRRLTEFVEAVTGGNIEETRGCRAP